MSKTAVIYARFSCSKQREESIEGQLRVCHDWCAREGYEIVAEYCDHAISGRTDERPEFQRMIANAGESDIVLVYMMDRFSRDPYDAPVYKHHLAKRGVSLVSAMEAIPEGPEGIIYEKLLEGLAVAESRKTSLRVKRDMMGNARKHRSNGVRVYGYDEDADGRYVINEGEAAIVRKAFDLRIGGEAINAIADELASMGVTTSYGRPCTFSMVRSMLRNQKYRGRYSWADYVEEGGMPRIVDDETFFRAQGVHGKKRRKEEDWGVFLLSGKVICEACGMSMPGVSGRSSTGAKYEYYSCRHCKEVKPVRREWLEESIAKRLRALLAEPEEALRIATVACEAAEGASLRAEREAAQSALRKAEGGLQNILNAIERGIYPPGVNERIAQLEAQRDRARRDLDRLAERTVSPEELAAFLGQSSALDTKTLLEAFVYQVLVGADDVVVTLNYDTKKYEPARLTIERVRTLLTWCALSDSNARPTD